MYRNIYEKKGITQTTISAFTLGSKVAFTGKTDISGWAETAEIALMGMPGIPVSLGMLRAGYDINP